MRRCASDVARIYARMPEVLRALDDATLCEMGYPKATLAIAREVWPLPDLTIARVDMIAHGDGFRAIECNADTPAFVMETHRMNGMLCAEFGFDDPNAEAERHLRETLESAILAGIAALARPCPGVPFVAFTAFRNAPEDRETTRYQRALASGIDGIETAFVPLDELRIDSEALYDASGRVIDVLFRLWPIETLAKERDPESDAPIGAMLFDLVLRRRLALINPPAGFLLQSKAVQAVVWGLYEAGTFFDADERAAIARSFLPTYLDAPPSGDYVAKPVLGREGVSIEIVAEELRASSVERGFDEVPMAYQQYVAMPLVEARTASGLELMSALHTCFLVAGEPTAVGMRLGGPITDSAAYFLPLGYRRGRPLHHRC
jgi:glutathionylspermidine synthase